MNTTYHRYLAIALVASITSPFAGAQISGADDSAADGTTEIPAVRAPNSDMVDPNAATSNPTHPDMAAGASERFRITLDSAATVEKVSKATFETRDEVLAQLDARIETTGRVMNEIRADAIDLQGETRQSFISSVTAFREAEAEVHTNLSETRTASRAKFDDARLELINSLEAYAQAGAQLESIATTGKS